MVQEERKFGKVVIVGGTGFLGLNLARSLLERGFEVVLIARNPPQAQERWAFYSWDARTEGDWAACLDHALGVVNLVGRTVDCIKTPDHCDEILRSRVESTLALGKGLRAVENPPGVWVQMSTAHIYGDPPDLVCDESSAFGYGLAPTVGKEWENAYHHSLLPSQRGVVLRTSFVLGKSGGALPKMAKLAKWGLGGKVGSGKQGISWIHELDMTRLFERALFAPAMQGVYIATAPNPVSQGEFMKELRSVLRIPFGLPTFEWMARIGAPLLMKTDPELALYGRYCVPKRLQEEGFEFRFPTLRSAFQDLFQKS